MKVTIRNPHHRAVSGWLGATALVPVMGLFAGLAPSPARADCSKDADVWVCRGTVMAPVLINEASDITVKTEQGFSMNVAGASPALDIRGAGTVRLDDQYESPITAAGTDISVSNTISTGGDARTDIHARGPITSTSGSGISTTISNSSTSGGSVATTITAGTIQSGSAGISVNSQTQAGDALTEITVSEITSQSGEGIYSDSLIEGGDSTTRITAGTIQSGLAGVFVENNSMTGSVLTEITVSGGVTAGAEGIFSRNAPISGAQTSREGSATTRIAAGTVQSGSHGISVINHTNIGNALAEITVDEITSQSGQGVFIQNGTVQGDATTTIFADTVQSGGVGIYASNITSGAGDALAEVTASEVTARSGGIDVLNWTQKGLATTRVTADTIQSAGGDGIATYSYSRDGDSLSEIAVSEITMQSGWGMVISNLSYNGTATTRITADTIQSRGAGIELYTAMWTGDARTEVSVGAISAANGYGIYYDARSQAIDSRLDAVFDVGDISARLDAIYVAQRVSNLGDRSGIFINSRGDIRSLEGTGIHIKSLDADTRLVVNGLVQGGNGYAIDVNRSGSADRQATVELRPGYALEGATLATFDDGGGRQIDLANSHLVLGGSGSAGFDLNRIDNRAAAIDAGNPDRVTGFGSLTKSGDSLWTLSGANDADAADAFLYANVDAGILALDDAASLVLAGAGSSAQATGMLGVASGATLASNGASSVRGSVNNAGTVALSNQYAGGGGIAAGDTLTISGNYVGNDSLLTVDTALAGDASATDRLVIDGDTSGSSLVKVYNAGGAGAQTVEGIRLIDVGGASDGSFTLLGDYVTKDDRQAVVAGAYAYTLEQNGVSTPMDGNWYLRSTLIQAESDPPDAPRYSAAASVYEAYPQALLGLNGVPTLQQRVGNRAWAQSGNLAMAAGASGAPMIVQGTGVWGRIEGAHDRIRTGRSTTGVDLDQDIFKMQVGIDGLLRENESGRLVAGAAVHYAHGSADTKSLFDAQTGGGRIRTDGYGLGGTLTWYGQNGGYLDAQAQATWYDSDLKFAGGRPLVKGNDGFGYALSLEGGKRIALDSAWSLTPQAQLVYSRVDFDRFHDAAHGTAVRLDKGDSLRGRLGVTLDHEASWQGAGGKPRRAHVYGVANLYYELLDGTRVEVQGTRLSNRGDRMWGGIGFGGSYNWDDDRYSLYGEGLVNASLNDFDSHSLKGLVGLRMRW